MADDIGRKEGVTLVDMLSLPCSWAVAACCCLLPRIAITEPVRWCHPLPHRSPLLHHITYTRLPHLFGLLRTALPPCCATLYLHTAPHVWIGGSSWVDYRFGWAATPHAHLYTPLGLGYHVSLPRAHALRTGSVV